MRWPETQPGIPLFDMHSQNQGIIHVIGPELGITQPGFTLVCGDSHTSTHGAFGTLAFGIGTSDVEHVLATQCLSRFKSKTMQIEVQGQQPKGVTAKDIVLSIIGKMLGEAGEEDRRVAVGLHRRRPQRRGQLRAGGSSHGHRGVLTRGQRFTQLTPTPTRSASMTFRRRCGP